MNKYIICFLTILFVLFSSQAFSQQDEGSLIIKGSVKVERAALAGAKVIVFKNGTKQKTYQVDSKGKFEFSIELQNEYEIVVTKQGYYSKKLWFNTDVPKIDIGIWNYRFIMTMIPEIDGFDASLLEKPIGKIMFVEKVNEFDYDEDYTFDMLKQLESLMKQYEKARREAFKKTIAKADAAFDKKEYDLAIELYDKAIDLDPYDPYPDDQMYMISKIIRQDENSQINYDKNIAEADKYFEQKDYSNAKKYYNRAFNYIEERYPIDQIKIIDDILNNQDALLADQEAKDKAYIEAVAAGDRLFVSKQYENSLSKFTNASDIKPEENYPKEKIEELNLLLAQLAKEKGDKEEIERAYREAIAKADANFGKNDYALARTGYINASQIKPAETYPKTKIVEIDNLLAANKSIEEKYKGFIAVADKSFSTNEYESAKKYYQQALSIKPNEAYPKLKINEIDALLLKLAAQRKKDVDGNYARLIAAGDIAFNKKDYEPAKTHYTQALELKNEEVYPKNRIDEINKILADIANKKRTYDLAIARADNSFNIEKWEDAKVNYQQALTIFPTEQYPQTRLNEIENKLLALKSVKDQKVAREKAYNDAIAKADALFTEKKFPESKNSYNNALALKSEEAYPKQRIAEIEKLLLEQKALDDRYNALIASADQQFLNEDYIEAKSSYGRALQVKSDEAYPKQKISEIDKLIAAQKDSDSRYNAIIATADSHFQNKKYNDAKVTYTNALQIKPNEVYPKQKIAEIDKQLASMRAIDDKYSNTIATADLHFQNKKYNEAKETYTNALQLKPNEEYPKQKISEIDVLLAQLFAAKAKADESKKQYDQIIIKADTEFTNKMYSQARGYYQQAASVLPDEVYPKQRLVEIDNLLAGIADKDKKYKEAISTANQLFDKKSYGEALAFYNQASGVKPDEVYPKERITKINSILADLQKDEAAYDDFITLADAAFSSNKLESAKGQYQAAAGIKPNETYPKQRIAEINKLLAEQTRLAAEREKIDAQYKTYIANADISFNQKSYQQAKTEYSQALQLKENEMYPKQRIAEIDNIIAKQAATQKAYDEKMAEGANLFAGKNLPGALAAYQQASSLKPDDTLSKQKINEVQSAINANTKKLQQYKMLIAQADNSFNQKKYSAAKPIYQQASSLMSNEDYPKSQISKIDALLAEAVKREAELQALIKSYNAKIAEADKEFDSKNFNDALSAYMDAKMIKGDETYPDEQMAKINKIVKDNAAKLEADYNNALNQGDKYKSSKSYSEAKIQYTNALSLKPNDATAKAKIIEVDNLIEQDRLAKQNQAKVDADYRNAIKNADGAFKTKDFAAAISLYKSAKNLKPDEKYPNDQIDICEQKIKEMKALAAAEEEKRRKAELAASQGSFDKNDFDYSGEKRDRNFLNDLAKEYPEGVTVENYDKKNKKIKRVIVNRGGIAKEYIEVKYSYGTYYFRNGQNISRGIFYSETKK